MPERKKYGREELEAILREASNLWLAIFTCNPVDFNSSKEKLIFS